MGRLALRPALRAYAHAPAGVEEEFGNSEGIYLDGVDDRLYTSGNWPELSASGSGYSVSLWVKGANANKVLLNIGSSNSSYRIQVRTMSKANSYQIRLSTADPSDTSISFISNSAEMGEANTWQHLVVSDPGDATTNGSYLYINGRAVNRATGKALGASPAASTLHLSSSFGTSFANAYIDEVSIFDTALNASQVLAIYNGGKPSDLSEHADIKHWWRFESSLGDSASSVADQIGSWDLDTVGGAPALQTDVPYVIPRSVHPYYADATTSGSTITIKGSNLGDVSSVAAGGNAFTSVSASASQITASSANNGGTDATVDLVLTDSTNNSAVTMPDRFVYRSGSVPAWTNTKSVYFSGSSVMSSKTPWHGLYDSGSGYSVSFWLKAVTPLAQGKHIFNLAPRHSGQGYRCLMFSTATTGTITRESTGSFFDTSFAQQGNTSIIPDSDWHHYVVTSPGDGGAFKTYKDGSLFSTSSSGKAMHADPTLAFFSVGGRADLNTVVAFEGTFSEIAIFSSELDSSAVSSLYNSGTPADLTSHSDIQHYYRMGDGIGDTASRIRDQIGGMDLDLAAGSPSIVTDVP